MENTLPIIFRFASIQIISKTVVELSREAIAPSFNFDIRVETRVKAPQSLVVVFVYVNIKDVDKKDPIASFVVACLFEITDFDKIILLNEENVHIIPPQLSSIFTPVSISTTRGVIFSELRGTHLHNAIMPVVFMNQLKEEEKEPPKESFITT